MNEILNVLKKSRILILKGNNFTGKSYVLQKIIDKEYLDFLNDTNNNSFGLYIGPEIYNAISGISSTVLDELYLHGYDNNVPTYIEDIIQCTKLNLMFDNNPFLLSGGEQASLILVCSLLSKPIILALDGIFEQLSFKLRESIFSILINNINRLESYILFTDNRIEEIFINFDAIDIQNVSFKYLDKKLPIESLLSKNIELLPYMHSPDITLENICFSYKDNNEIFENISFSFLPKNIYILTGENGIGKSTLAKILSGIIKPVKGKIYSASKEIIPWKTPASIVAYHFQNPDLQLFETTILDEVNANKQVSDKITDYIIQSFGLSKLVTYHPLGLSIPFVLRKRVALAATLNMNRGWFILDEPTLLQDKESSKKIVEMINSLVKKGRGVIVIAHSKSLIDEINGIKLEIIDKNIRIV